MRLELKQAGYVALGFALAFAVTVAVGFAVGAGDDAPAGNHTAETQPAPTATPTETPYTTEDDQVFCDDYPDDGFDCEPGLPRRNDTPTPTPTETPSLEGDMLYPDDHPCAGERYPQDDCPPLDSCA